jgi:hypothetical protein
LAHARPLLSSFTDGIMDAMPIDPSLEARAGGLAAPLRAKKASTSGLGSPLGVGNAFVAAFAARASADGFFFGGGRSGRCA